MAEAERGRIYGMADADQQQPPPEQGMRGEQGAAAGDGAPGLSQRVTLGDDHVVELEQSSGAAFAEVTGALERSRGDVSSAPDRTAAVPTPSTSPHAPASRVPASHVDAVRSPALAVAADRLRSAAGDPGVRSAVIAGAAGAVTAVALWLLRGPRRNATPAERGEGLAHRSDGSGDDGSYSAGIADEGMIPDVDPRLHPPA